MARQGGVGKGPRSKAQGHSNSEFGIRSAELETQDVLLKLNSERECFRLLKMKAAVTKKAKNEAELLDHATGNLLRAVKQKMLKKQGRVDLAKLRKEGYSDRFLDKLERA